MRIRDLERRSDPFDLLGRARVDLGGEIDQIDLVDRDHHMGDLQERRHRQMAPGLLHHSVARIHQQHDGVGRGGAGDRVARVLHVPGAVGQDEGALRGGEVAIATSMVMPCSRSARRPSVSSARSAPVRPRSRLTRSTAAS